MRKSGGGKHGEGAQVSFSRGRVGPIRPSAPKILPELGKENVNRSRSDQIITQAPDTKHG
jgi:hypothetical protein